MVKRIIEIRDDSIKTAGHFDYGANVIPVIKYYTSLTEYELKKLFLSAIEEMLSSKDENLRQYAITLCLGFITFKDSI